MIVQSACQGSPPRLSVLATDNLSRPKCPRCGSVLLVAEESRFNTDAANAAGRIDHDWSCDSCGNAFATSIKLPTR